MMLRGIWPYHSKCGPGLIYFVSSKECAEYKIIDWLLGVSAVLSAECFEYLIDACGFKFMAPL